jgi:hypothetical protein
MGDRSKDDDDEEEEDVVSDVWALSILLFVAWTPTMQINHPDVVASTVVDDDAAAQGRWK